MIDKIIYILSISPNAWDIIKTIVTFIFGGLGLAIFNKLAAKKKEALEISNLSSQGDNLLIQVKTNIDKLVETKTLQLNEQINILQATIIDISIKYKKDVDAGIAKMADIERRLDLQISRNEKSEERNEILEINLEREIKARENCIRQLKDLQKRVYELEKISSPISNLQKNNPDNKSNTL